MKKILFICLFIGFLNNAFCLSDQTEVSVLTCGAGKELHSSFGHSAIRIHDPATKLDVVYNYGIFNFKTPNFVLKFLRGKLEYKLKKGTFKKFKEYYRSHNRSVYEQVLNLEYSQINLLHAALEENVKPENRFYIYDFYNANCSTKIIDQLSAALGDNLQYISPSVKASTFRQSIQQICINRPWLSLGLDFLQGRNVDKVPYDLTEKTNLPIKLFDELKNCYIKIDKNSKVPLVGKYITVHESNFIDIPKQLSPKIFFWILFIIACYITFSNALSLARLFDWLLFMSLGLIGLMTIFTWSISSHLGFSFHVNAIWINPLHLIVAFYILFNPGHVLIKKYFLNYNIVFFGMLVYILLYSEEFHTHILPLFLTVLLRSLGRSGKANFKFSLFRSI